LKNKAVITPVEIKRNDCILLIIAVLIISLFFTFTMNEKWYQNFFKLGQITNGDGSFNGKGFISYFALSAGIWFNAAGFLFMIKRFSCEWLFLFIGTIADIIICIFWPIVNGYVGGNGENWLFIFVVSIVENLYLLGYDVSGWIKWTSVKKTTSISNKSGE
jgi:hypothetical protein